ncbi:MAG: hypothetical protein IT350_20645 [Deltaproteobacteria bacterium]|nr:hypothetical protein [Deltaproteobacteria bacterium]
MRTLESNLEQIRVELEINASFSPAMFLDKMNELGLLTEVRLNFPVRPTRVIARKDRARPEHVACALSQSAYLSHYTALVLHDLTDDIPKIVYVTIPQPRKSDSRALTQEEIDDSMSRPARETTDIAQWSGFRIARLRGQDSGGLEIIERELAGYPVRVTSIERTLIDVVVRPECAGGTHRALEAFRRAQGRISVNRLVGILRSLDYSYPWHQALGYYLERSGAYPAKSIAFVRRLPIELDFYLEHGIGKSGDYVPEWRLWIPRNFEP